jgi:hypothetical protein
MATLRLPFREGADGVESRRGGNGNAGDFSAESETRFAALLFRFSVAGTLILLAGRAGTDLDNAGD